MRNRACSTALLVLWGRRGRLTCVAGIVKQMLALVICWLIKSCKLLTIDGLNHMVDTHPYSPHTKHHDKPGKMKKEHFESFEECKLKQSAAQVNQLALVGCTAAVAS